MRFLTCLVLSAIFLIGSYQWLMHHPVQDDPRALGGFIYIFLMAGQMPGFETFYAVLWVAVAILLWLALIATSSIWKKWR